LKKRLSPRWEIELRTLGQERMQAGKNGILLKLIDGPNEGVMRLY
jgi:hypothetical protein